MSTDVTTGSATADTATAITSAPDEAGRERLYRYLLFGCASVSILVTVGIVVVLTEGALSFFASYDPVAFFLGTEWVISQGQLGVLPLLSGTILVTVLSAMVAIPIGLAAATYLSEYASPRMRSILKPALEILAGIPTVVYGYFALVYITPFLITLGLPLGTFNVLSASIMVGIMIVPMVSSLSEDAMSAVPDSLREAGYGLGATKYEVSTGIVIPAAISGIFSSFILALSRAIGETMIVAVAMGQSPQLVEFFDPLANLFESNQPMTSAMIQLVNAENAAGPVYRSMFAIGLTLFVVTFAMNLVSDRIAARYREEYE
ncbi:Phosphate ABC transporter permease protein [Halorhabdus tiamatea SARL4B]|uniref:Phosphate transport system permease protein n=1 Tax=Halorhabdus tiamatea SARL4B TaxID=1033806 RepID=F7PM95_9EURY|nr:phosphate ABC transporter permease subunit PstC [Halorhabdus tiamatea]ERJ05500.1 Phosphate ABC transporter permease protein [Halorhabdus tiamatea SARL4B]CCQ32909.1 phosphate transport system permease protein PstC (TC 3.A.1.7.1) [Halorhabdus tiamatea SARL4B]